MEKRNYKLYVHISPSNKRYYGITGREKVELRWQNGRGYIGNEYFTRAINKYGWENFKHIVLFSNLTKEEACLLEQCYIALYDTMNPKYGYNNTLGGEHGLPSEHSKHKMSEAKKGKYNGENNPMYGKHFTEEHRRKLSEGHKGRPTWNKGKHHTEETKRKIGEARKGIKPTAEIIEKRRQGIKKAWANPNSVLNDPSYRQKFKGGNNPNAKPILMFTLDGEFIRKFDCVAEANEYMGKPRHSNNIKMCARGKGKTAYGYHWEYVTEEQEEQVI